MSPPPETPFSPAAPQEGAEPPFSRFKPLAARAVLLGERIDTAGLDRSDVLSGTPFCTAVDGGVQVVFRYGVVVLIGLRPEAEAAVLHEIAPRVSRPFAVQDEETILLAPMDQPQDPSRPDAAVRIRDLSPERLLVVADALAKSAALSRDERQVSEVFDTIEPWARELSERGRRAGSRKAMIRLIGAGLLVQHRVAGRVAVGEKPEVLWERPDLERLYARLEDEYELLERAQILNRKLDLIGETATLLTELIDTDRSFRLEAVVVALIVMELVLTLFQIAKSWG